MADNTLFPRRKWNNILFPKCLCRCLCTQKTCIYIYIQSMPSSTRHSIEQPQKAWLSDIPIFSHVQIHCACQWIMTLAPKILTLATVLNTWTVTNFQKSSFYHTNHTFLTSINVWMMDSSSINSRIKKNGPRKTAFYVGSDLVKNPRFATAQ